jgi:hypothetical protein
VDWRTTSFFKQDDLLVWILILRFSNSEAAIDTDHLSGDRFCVFGGE